MFEADCVGGDWVFDQHHKVNSIVDVISARHRAFAHEVNRCCANPI
jgi:hypothetical protein